MNETLKIVLSLSLSGTLLFFILLALKPLYKNKLSKSWQYYIWLIVIVRMLLPCTPETTLVGSAFAYFENINVEITQGTSPVQNDQSDFGTDNDYIAPDAERQTPKSTMDATSPVSMQAVFSNVYENLWILWAAIAFALLIRKITMYQSFVRFVKAGRSEVADIEILNMLADVGEAVGVKRPVELFINPLISSPMLLGFFRPYIILPSIELESTELAYIMRHELTHYKHLDMFYKWLVQVTVCLHWFNPFAYLLAKEINKCCELSCDEAIIRTLGKDEKKAYGDTLLNSLKALGNYNDKLATVTLTEGAEQLKERLDAIMKFKKKSKAVIVATLVLTTMLCIGATAVGAYAAAPKSGSPWSVMGGTGQQYTYSQSGYYQGSYIFELGWNLNENFFNAYTEKINLTLSDKTTITVSFDNSCKSELQNQDVQSNLKTLIDKLKSENANVRPLERPLVVSIKYIGNSDLVKLAEEYYTNGELTKFSAIFSTLDFEVQKKYCDKMVEDGKTAFLSASAENMNVELLDYCAARTYQEDKIALFSCIVPHLTNEQKQVWVTKSSTDGKNTFLSVLTDAGTAGVHAYQKPHTKIEFDGKSSAYAIIEKCSKVNTDLSIAEYADKVVKICDTAGTDIFTVLAEAEIISPNDPLYNYTTSILANISSDLFVDTNINDEKAFISAHAQWNGAKGETIVDDFGNEIAVPVSQQNVAYFVFYELSDKTKVTVAQREHIFSKIESEMQSYISSLKEDVVFSNNFKELFEDNLQIVMVKNSIETLSLKGAVSTIDGYKDSKNAFLSVPKDMGASANSFPNAVHKYEVNSSGKIEIPVSFNSISSGSEICLGAIPDIRNATSIHYDVYGESGGSLFVGISPESGKGMKHSWIGSVESATRNIVWDSGNSIGYSKEYTGDYYVYIQSKYGDCLNITGSIVIEYDK